MASVLPTLKIHKETLFSYIILHLFLIERNSINILKENNCVHQKDSRTDYDWIIKKRNSTNCDIIMSYSGVSMNCLMKSNKCVWVWPRMEANIPLYKNTSSPFNGLPPPPSCRYRYCNNQHQEPPGYFRHHKTIPCTIGWVKCSKPDFGFVKLKGQTRRLYAFHGYYIFIIPGRRYFFN